MVSSFTTMSRDLNRQPYKERGSVIKLKGLLNVLKTQYLLSTVYSETATETHKYIYKPI